MRFQENVHHLPYNLDETNPRTRLYETLWKTKGMDLLLQHLPDTSHQRLLDYGCGRGEFLQIAADKGFDVEGCDPDTTCVKLSEAYGSCRLLTSEPITEIYARKEFDVISCFHVLEHVDRPLHLLEELRTICKGYLLLAVPNLRVLRYFRKKPFPDRLVVNQGHLQGWDHQTFLNLCIKHAGLEFVGWAHDTTVLPIASPVLQKLFGFKTAMHFETGIFLRMLPYHCNSIIGLFRCPDEA